MTIVTTSTSARPLGRPGCGWGLSNRPTGMRNCYLLYNGFSTCRDSDRHSYVIFEISTKHIPEHSPKEDVLACTACLHWSGHTQLRLMFLTKGRGGHGTWSRHGHTQCTCTHHLTQRGRDPGSSFYLSPNRRRLTQLHAFKQQTKQCNTQHNSQPNFPN